MCLGIGWVGGCANSCKYARASSFKNHLRPTPTPNTKQDFYALKELFIARGERFVKDALNSRAKIAELGHSFVRDGTVRLVWVLVVD